MLIFVLKNRPKAQAELSEANRELRTTIRFHRFSIQFCSIAFHKITRSDDGVNEMIRFHGANCNLLSKVLKNTKTSTHRYRHFEWFFKTKMLIFVLKNSIENLEPLFIFHTNQLINPINTQFFSLQNCHWNLDKSDKKKTFHLILNHWKSTN